MTAESSASRLRGLLRVRPCLLAPGVYDCLSAMLAAEAGFAAISISGYSAEAAQFGLPDLGFMGLSDIEDVARRIAAATPVPAICDADTGYGGINNVWQTVRRLEAAGVAGLHIEDQADPKKCGGLPGRKVIPAAEMVAKLRAACAARRDPDTLIVARSDARGSEGIEAVAERLNLYLQAGADMAFAAEKYDPEEVTYLAGAVRGPFAICGGVPGWSGSHETARRYGEIGVDLVIYPFSSLYVAAGAMRAAYARMAREDGLSKDMAEETMVGFEDFSSFIGVDAWERRERAFAENETASNETAGNGTD